MGAFLGWAEQVHYTAAKAGIVGLVRSLAVAAAVATLDDPAVVDVEQIVVHGAPEDVLLEAAADADLLIVGAHHRRIGRGVSSAVLTEAPCPVIVVPAVQRG